jgi:hypothetical protein
VALLFNWTWKRWQSETNVFLSVSLVIKRYAKLDWEITWELTLHFHGILHLCHCGAYCALDSHWTTKLYFSIFKYKLLSHACIPVIIIFLKNSLPLKRSPAHSWSLSCGDNIVLTWVYNYKFALSWQGAADPFYWEYCPPPVAVPGDLIRWCPFSESLSSLIKIVHGNLIYLRRLTILLHHDLDSRGLHCGKDKSD